MGLSGNRRRVAPPSSPLLRQAPLLEGRAPRARCLKGSRTGSGPSASIRNWLAFAATILCVVSVTSCDGGKKPGKSAGGIERKVERGPVSAIVRLDKAEVTIADRVNLSIEVRAKEDYEVELPPVGDKLEQFGIADYRTSQPELVGTNEVVVRRTYVLEPFLSGDYAIKPFKVTFRQKSEAADVKHELETEEMTVKVKSLLPDKVRALKINDIVPPVRLPRVWKTAVWVAVLLGAVLLAAIVAILAVLRTRRGRGSAAAQAIPPHELAYRRLQELVDDDLVGKGRTKLFYQRISDILRHYIEDRFGLHAPEETTEEFLHELGAGDTLVGEHKTLLKDFLLNCDMVKFAEHQPETAEIQGAFDSCKKFISETVPKEVSSPL